MASSESPLVALAKANNSLAVRMHRMLAEERGNVFFSPLGLSTSMAMLLSAAEADTASELRAGLGHEQAGLATEDAEATFRQYLSLLLDDPEGYSLSCANALLVQKGFDVKDSYRSTLADSFKAELMEVDVQREASAVVTRINDWVSRQTRQMIPKLVDALDPATVLVLLNAVYFKGSWLNKFDEQATCARPFYGKSEGDVDMMHLRNEKFLYAENESFQALQLPYAGEEVAMLVLLPRARDGLADLESSLSPDFVAELAKEMRKRKVEVVLPKFRLEFTRSLVPHFQRLGVKRVFQRGAELGLASESPDLAVSEVLHKATLVVNEEGSEAAAATMVAIMCCSISLDPVFVADHPFALVIYDTRNDLILFMGRVEELCKSEIHA